MAQPAFKKKLPGTAKEKPGKETKTAAETPRVAGKQTQKTCAGRTRLSCDISMNSHRKLRVAAANQYTSIAQVVDKMIESNL